MMLEEADICSPKMQHLRKYLFYQLASCTYRKNSLPFGTFFRVRIKSVEEAEVSGISDPLLLHRIKTVYYIIHPLEGSFQEL